MIRFGSHGVSLPNAITIHKKPTAEGTQTTLYFSDSFQGVIFKIDKLDTCSLPCPVTTVSHDPLLATANHAFGIAANGIALSHDAIQLYIANLGDDRILRLDLPSGEVEVFAKDIARPDGIAFDAHGNLWVCSLTENEIVVLNSAARVIAKLGSFRGVNNKGEVLGLLGPASLVFNNNSVFVTNFVFPQIPAFVGANDVTVFTVAEIPVPAALR
jgi:DNA-binding beta-propeller fold protein YncE